MKKTILALFCFSLLACSGQKVEPPQKLARNLSARSLTREEALARSERISRVSYEIGVDLNREEAFSGKTVVRFTLRGSPQDLFLDFMEGKVAKLSINGQAADTALFDGQIIRLPAGSLRWDSANSVEVEYEHPYNHSGNGLHQFKDPVDGRIYLYTQFEPFSAHRFFPCFDQPDLKATYELNALAPKDWKVISSAREVSVKTEGKANRWVFPVSDRFSTYIFSLHAGPFAEWKDQAGPIPLRLFARQSLKQYVDAPEWFAITKGGLKFFGETFAYPYPFHKYDQLVVPDFNAGAMENVAAVTFTERYIFRSKVTTDARLSRASTILHEMAHMWFGDLVTMDWWNGLWLNESFATFMASWAVDKATPYKGAWQEFNGSKEWAMWEDQLVTTHPIEAEIPDTDASLTSFDGITYGKGAAALKQIFFLLGEEKFKAGVRAYFQKHAFGNATLEDFVSSLSAASGQDLTAWQEDWLQSAGVNSLRAQFSCAEGKISAFSLLQEKDEGDKILRPHRTKVGLFYLKDGKLVMGASQAVAYAKAETPVPGFVGSACPDLVFTNVEDHDYVKVRLDEKSLAQAKINLGQVADPFLRQQIWNSLMQMVTDGVYPAHEFLDTLLLHGQAETDSKTLKTLFGYRERLLRYLPAEKLGAYRAKLETFLQDGLRQATGGSDLQLLWFRALASEAQSAESIARLEKLLRGQEKLAGLAIDQDRRWEIIGAIARTGGVRAKDLIDAELKRDATDNGRKEAFGAEAQMPDPVTKQRWLSRITRTESGGREYKLAELRPAMQNFYVLGQDALTQMAEAPYFAVIARAKTEEEEYIGRFARAMFPPLCEERIVKQASAFLAAHEDYPVYVTKPVRQGRQETERCLRARALSRANSKAP
ncbi:MAG: aminopeptidase N [Proteobacteria bacterium]|nr:MAG: aminopeptidase N [Pseudomonadota bacterium]